MIGAGDGTGQLLYSKEGVTHGDPLAIVVYGLGNPPPLIQELWTAHHSVTQTWYADESRSGGTFKGICFQLDDLMGEGASK